MTEMKKIQNHNQREQKARPRGSENTWRHTQQAYFVADWSTTDPERTREQRAGKSRATTSKTINCFVRGSKPKKLEWRRIDFEDGDSDSEEEQMVCSMTGQSWESLPFPVVIDSGACASIMPSGWCKHVPLQKTNRATSSTLHTQSTATLFKLLENIKCKMTQIARNGSFIIKESRYNHTT